MTGSMIVNNLAGLMMLTSLFVISVKSYRLSCGFYACQSLVLAGLVRMAARVLMAKPPQAVNRGELGWLTTSPMVILLVMMLAMGTHIPQPVIRILAGASTIVLSGTHDLPAQRSTWHDFLPSGTASVSEKHSER